MADNENTFCGQCGKPAIGTVHNVPLCVTHWAEFQTAHTSQLRHAMAMMNHAEEQMAQISGLPHLARPVRIPALPPGPVTMNSFRIENSSVGVINTGNVRDIAVSLNQLHNA